MPRKRKKRLTAKQEALAKQRREWQQELDEARRQQRMAKAKRQEQSGPLPGAPAGARSHASSARRAVARGLDCPGFRGDWI